MKGYYNLPMNRQLGLFEYYHNNGKLRSRGYFHEGLREGTWKTWNESGQLTDSIFFRNDQPEVEVHYGYKGNKVSAYVMSDNRTKHKIARNFENAILRNESEFHDREGVIRTYYGDGKTLSSVMTYGKAGKITDAKYYKPNGEAYTEKEWKANLKEEEKRIAERAPEYPGGRTAFEAYMQKHFVMPETVGQDFRPTRTVTVSFYLNKHGKAFNIEFPPSSDPTIARKVIEVLERMPEWKMKEHEQWGPIQYTVTIRQ